MKNVTLILLVAAALFGVVGCADNGPAHAEDVTKKIQDMPAEERFKLIKANTGMSLPMKDRSIDSLPVDSEQKRKWKEELRQAGAGAPVPGAGMPSNSR